MALVMHSGFSITTCELPTGLSEIPQEVRCPHIDLSKTKVSCKRQHQIRLTMTMICKIPSLAKIAFNQIS
jgi:hypothetical protein